MTVKITLKQLKQADACEDQLKLFKETFGEEVGFKTKAQAIKTASKMAHKFNLNWASLNLLSEDYRKAYEEAVVPLWETYLEAEAPLMKVYREALAKEFAKCYFNQEDQKNHS